MRGRFLNLRRGRRALFNLRIITGRMPPEANVADFEPEKAFVPRTPRVVTYFVREGTEDAVPFRVLKDAMARTDGWPIRATAIVPDPLKRAAVEANGKAAVSHVPDVTFEVAAAAPVLPRVAVITPAYNVESLLPQCLDSLLAQSMPVEIFCCDDGSTDGTRRILEDYAARCPRVHAFHHPHRGMSATYNRLLDELPPDIGYVGIVDSDDYVHPEMFGSLMSAMSATGADVAECGVAFVPAAAVQPSGTSVASVTDRHRTIDDMSIYWIQKTGERGWKRKWNKLYRREVIGTTRFRVGLDYEDDFLFTTELIEAIRRKVIVADRFYGYRDNPNSFNGRIDFRKYLSSAALRLRLSCETFLAPGRVPKRLEAGWRRDWAKDAYRMLVRKNLKNNPDAALRRKLFRTAGERLEDMMRDFGVGLDGLNPVQWLLCRCCLRDRYALARLLVALT